jgi:hypothetical protein
VTRSTRNIALGLIGSALLFGCCCVSCVDIRDEEEKDENGNVVRHHHRFYYRPWLWHSGGYYGGGSYGRSPAPTFAPVPGRTGPGGAPRSTSGETGRGGFGGTGSAVS